MDTPTHKKESPGPHESPQGPPSSTFSELLRDADAGGEAAIWTLVKRFSPHVRRVLAGRIGSSLQSRLGVSDIVQAMWASLLLDDSDLARFQSEQELVAYITGIAINKLRMHYRTHLGAQRRDCRREVPVDAAQLDAARGQQQTASEIFIFRESWNQFLQNQPEHYRQIVQLRLDGLTFPQIAHTLHLNERTVRRVLSKLVNEIRDPGD